MAAREVRAGKAYVELSLRSKLNQGLRRAQRRLQAFGASVGRFGAQLTALSAAAAVPLGFAAKTFAGFSDQMLAVKAVTSATQDEFDALNAKAKELGRTTSFTAAEVAGAMLELGRAGFKPQEIDDAIAGMLDLARATGSELPRATEIAGAALRGFNLPAEQAGRVADVLTAGANNSAQTIEDLGESLKLVAPIAVEANASIEDTVASLGVLANNGIKGSLAGNAVARAYKNLADPAIRQKVEALGVTVVDSLGNLRPLSRVITDLGQRTKGLGNARRLAVFEEVFGRGQAAALKLASSGANFDDLAAKLKNANGVAAATAKTMDSGLGGAIRRMLSAIEGVAIAVGEALAGSLSDLADRVSAAALVVSKLVQKNKGLVVGALKVIAVVGAVGAVLVAAGALVWGLGAAFGALASVIGVVAGAFGVVATVIGAVLSPIGLVVAAVLTLGATLAHVSGFAGQVVDYLKARFAELKAFAAKTFQGIGDALAAGDIALAARILWLALKVVWQKGVAALQALWARFSSWFVGLATDAFYGAAVVLNNSIAAMQRAWLGFTSWLGKKWADVKGDAASAWNLVGVLAKKTANRIRGAFDDSFDVKAANAKAEDEFVKSQHAIELENAKAVREIDRTKAARAKAIEKDRASTEAVLVGKADAAEAARKAQRDKAIADSESALAEARTEWEKAIAQARQAREETPADGTAPQAPKFDANLLGIQIAEGLAAASDAVAKAGAARGTFNAAALQALQTDSITSRIAEATESTATHTKRIAQAAANGLAFAP